MFEKSGKKNRFLLTFNFLSKELCFFNADIDPRLFLRRFKLRSVMTPFIFNFDVLFIAMLSDLLLTLLCQGQSYNVN